MADSPVSSSNFSDPLIGRFFLTPDEKADKEKGKAIIKAIYATQTSNDASLNYFKGRNTRWIMLLLWAKGSQNIQEFLDYINVSDANKAWVNIDMTQSRIAAQFVSTLVESMSKTKTYPSVNAVDDGSINEKEQRLFEALFRMHEVETIKDIQQQTGVQLEPTNAYVPNDELSARVYFELEDKLPKEIRFEKMLNSLQKQIQFERVLNRKTVYDLTVLNCSATKIEKLGDGEYSVRRCVPTNLVYNFFMNDTGGIEISQIGEFYGLKVKDFRVRFGKTDARPNGLDEKQIFELAKQSTNKNIGTFNFMWNNNWALTTYNQNRPYDDAQIMVFDCEVNFEEEEYYVSKKDAYGKENIQRKNNVPYQQKTKDGRIIEQPKPEDTTIIKKKNNTWMRGVYAPYSDTMLYWGKPDLIISPYTNTAVPLSSYTINIPNNDGEYVPSLFERILEPLREYQLTKLKRKQLIAKVKPSGIRIDVESARNLDLGNGDSVQWEEVVRIYDQTGNELWSSKGLDPLTPERPPLSNTVQNTTVNDIIGLTNILLGIVNEIRQLIGVPMYRDGSDVGDRTAASLAEGQNSASYNVTDFVVNANNQLWEETFNKVCLLHWNDIVKTEPESKDDMINTRFEVSVKMKSSDYQKQLLEQDIQRYSQVVDAQGNPAITPKDAMFLREIDNDRLARWYLATTIESNRRKSMDDSIKLQQTNAQVQQQSAQQAAQLAQQQQQEKMDAEKDMEDFRATKQKELALLNGVLAIAQKGLEVPNEWKQVIQLLVPNISIPLAAENKQMQDTIIMNAQKSQMEDMQEQGQGGGQEQQESAQGEQAEPQQEPQQQEQAELQPQ
jgi:hypothetical protein